MATEPSKPNQPNNPTVLKPGQIPAGSDKAGPHLNPPEVKETTPPYLQPQAEIDPIMIAVTNNPNFRDSIIALLDGVSQEITTNADDPNAVRKVAAKLKERAGHWADNATANTNYAPVTGTENEKGRQEREAKEKQNKETAKK